MRVLVLIWPVLLLTRFVGAQLIWSPIYVPGNNQIDLWTQRAKGCMCPWDRSSDQCACCVEDGGCHCGKEAPNRCTQCGLEKYCNHMCNISIASVELTAKSGKSFGQIKSPSMEGPSSCWYTFIPNSYQRVEIQIYRLIETGKHNGTNCVGGFLQLTGGAEPQFSYSDNQICGMNERYSPPVVFFSDDGLATLLFQISEKTRRSQFLAYFSFTMMNNTDGLGYLPKGGMKLQNTDCDWLYQDTNCNKSRGSGKGLGPCVLASPGYPGLYPPYRQCKYHIRTSNENVQVRIQFVSVLLPHDRCHNDYVAVYRGSTTTGPRLATLCDRQRKTLEFSGPNLLVEFSSGPQVPPYDYNGFLASLRFYEKTTTTSPPSVVTVPSNEIERITHGKSAQKNSVKSTSPTPEKGPETHACDIRISGNNTRYGQFNTREHEWFPVCHLIFYGRSADVVHISFLYRLTTPNCKSMIEVLDGSPNTRKTTISQICSPETKLQMQSFMSTGSSMTIVFKRPTAPLSTSEAEYISGYYFFHNEQMSGTLQPDTICNVEYNGSNSPLAGMIDNPASQQYFLMIDGPLSCRQTFLPSLNQSVVVRISKIEGMSKDPKCITQCGDNGCRCVSEDPLKYIDHVMMVGEGNITVACLCGPYLDEYLPVTVRTWSPVTLIYSSSNHTWKAKRFSLTALYSFKTDFVCGMRMYTLHAGEITMRNVSTVDRAIDLNFFFRQNCIWILHSNVERQLEFNISTTQNRPCTAWNITIHEYTAHRADHLGDLLQTFCPRDFHKHFQLRWNLNTVVVRLNCLSRTLPQFRVKWKSQVVRAAITKFVGATPSPNAIAGSTNPARFVWTSTCYGLLAVWWLLYSFR